MMYDERPQRRRPITATNHRHEHLNPCVSSLIHSAIDFFGPWFFRFPPVRPFCDFPSPILSATFKDLSTIHTSRTYRIDRGELSRYTTPYLNSSAPSSLAPPSTFFLSLVIARTSNHASLHQHPSSFHSACFSLCRATSNSLFFSLHCHYHHHISRHPSHNLLASSQFFCIR